MKLLRSCLNMSAHDAPSRAAPRLGADNRDVLADWLELDAPAARQLSESAAMGSACNACDAFPL